MECEEGVNKKKGNRARERGGRKRGGTEQALRPALEK